MPSPFIGSVGILGGSFNPVHNGHLRLAIEVRETLGLARVDLLPARVPPHKIDAGLLDFELRLELVGLAVAAVPGLGVCALEGEMPVPSYSYATLNRLRETQPDTNHVFILGGTDLLTLPEWHRGLEIPLLTDLAVALRGDTDTADLEGFLAAHWDARSDGPGVFRIAGGGRVAFVTAPRLDISSSLVRDKFLHGRELCALVPDRVRQRMLAAARHFADRWSAPS